MINLYTLMWLAGPPSPRAPAGRTARAPARQRAPTLVERLRAHRARRRAIAALERLPDRMLADIGVVRADIPDIVAGRTPAPAAHPARAVGGADCAGLGWLAVRPRAC